MVKFVCIHDMIVRMETKMHFGLYTVSENKYNLKTLT